MLLKTKISKSKLKRQEEMLLSRKKKKMKEKRSYQKECCPLTLD